MSLKTDMARDLDEVFLNTEEFAEPRRVGGREIKCVFYETEESAAVDEYGRDVKSYTLQAKTADLPQMRVGDMLNIDTRAYTITNVRRDYGMTVAELALMS